MQLRYNYRLYPSPGQRDALARAFGCARVVFNNGLRARQEAHAAGQPYLTDAELSARLTASKAAPERAWLGEVSAVVLQQSLADLNTAYRNFFASVTGKRRAEKKLRRAQRSLSRKEKGSRNRDKARVKVARAHAQVADARREFHQQLPTSQTCSACGVKDGPKPLHVRAWQCQECGAWLDRDINAAVNVAKAAGLAVTAVERR